MHSAPFLRFSHILLCTNFFSYVCYHMKYCSNTWWHCCSEFNYYFFISVVKGLIWTIFFFLTFIVLIQWNFPWKIIVFYLPTKLQAMLLLVNKSESLECAKVVVLKMGAILFYSGIHFKPLKLWEKKDLNRHIPQKINEFASLALAGRCS